MTQRELVTMGEHARLCGVTKAAVNGWKRAGKLVFVGNKVDHAASYCGELRHIRHMKEPAPAKPPRLVTLSRAEWAKRLQALDWTTTPDLSDEAQHRRVVAAAELVGLVAVLDEDPDGISRHGGYQLRVAELLTLYGEPCTAAVAGGYGFELDAHEALAACREYVAGFAGDGPADMAEKMTLDPAALVLLAHPLGAWHQRQPEA